MIKKFNVTVNGNVYVVDVEEIKSGEVSVPKMAPTQVSKPAAPKPAPAAQPAKVVDSTGSAVSAPMPGTILDIKVAVGSVVKKGEVLVVLEAMKMENEILAPADGTIAAVNVSKGASVNTGDALVTM